MEKSVLLSAIGVVCYFSGARIVVAFYFLFKEKPTFRHSRSIGGCNKLLGSSGTTGAQWGINQNRTRHKRFSTVSYSVRFHALKRNRNLALGGN